MIYTYLIVQNQNENTKYFVLDDIRLPWCKHRYLELQNCKNYEHKTIPIGYYTGTKRILVGEDVLSGIDGSPRFIFGRIYGDIIAVEDNNF